MTLFIDLRATPSGGVCAREASLWEDGVKPISVSEFNARIAGFDLVCATHGFNVSRHAGVQSLLAWSQMVQLPPTMTFIGVLWPGDSKYFPVIDYPFEGDEAIGGGRLLADFLNRNGNGAASLSFISHSLGARVMLETVKNLQRKARRLILMAGAIENNCLFDEYGSAAANVEEIYTLASEMDRVLEFAFPLGNPIGQLIMHGHPYFKKALGRDGPAQPISLEQRGGAWQVPEKWNYGHGDYLPDNVVSVRLAPPIQAPIESTPQPPNSQQPEWKAAWSAAAVSTQLC